SLVRLIVGSAESSATIQDHRRLRMLVASLFAITLAAVMAVIVNVLTRNSASVTLSVAVLGAVIAANLPLLRLTHSLRIVATIFVVEQILLLTLLTLMVGAVQPEFYVWYIVSLLLCTELVGRRIALPLAVLYGVMIVASQLLFQVDALALPLQAIGLTANPISRTLTIVNALIATALIAFAYESSRERAERQIARSEQQLRQHLDNTPLAALTIAPSGMIQTWNRSAENLFGYSHSEAVGASAGLLLAGLPASQRQAAVDELLASRHASNAITPSATKDGETLLCAWYHTPLFDTDGAFSGMACLALDITNQTRAAEELRTAKELAEASALAKNRFLGTISHEVRTPLNAIQGMTAALRDTSLTVEQQEITAAIQDGTESLLRLMGDVLDLSRLEAGALTIASEPFSVRAAVDDAVASLRAGADAKNLGLNHNLDAAIPDRLIGDGQRLRQILTNLLDNAVKFTEHGEITLSGSVRDATPERYNLLFSVSDTGIGIAPGEFDRLFQSFGQLDASSTRRYGGAGLGLAISRRLAHLMGGDLWLESREGAGSTFYFNILAAAAPPETAPPPPAVSLADAAPESRQLSLLVVDDNLVNQKVSVNLIRKLGHAADVVDNGQAAVEATARRHYDLILMDIHMPVMDGLEATRQILASAPAEACPVIVALTAAATAEDRKNALAAGMQDVLTKPIRLEQLAESIMRFFPPQSSPDEPADRPG
ncbi:MAG: response regulator, partial [Caldilineaceae bacterium]|nr:response regulator [Caldilineaceae bacterium]